MRQTGVRLLVLVAVVAAVATFGLMAALYEQLDDALPRSAPLTVLFAGLLEVILSFQVRARLAGRPGSKPILPITVARLAALARASSMVAALAFGGWTGVLAYTLPQGSDPPVAGADSITAALGLGSTVVLLVGALLLEASCRNRRR